LTSERQSEPFCVRRGVVIGFPKVIPTGNNLTFRGNHDSTDWNLAQLESFASQLQSDFHGGQVVHRRKPLAQSQLRVL
jgi:hypothetical protein